MSSGKMIYGLLAFCVATIFLGGCIPEDSLQWSADGTVGLMSESGALVILDERTGKATIIAQEDVGIWPGISEDGNWVAYSQAVKCSSLQEGLKSLPPSQVKMIEDHARLMSEIIIREGLSNGEFPQIVGGPTKCAGEYRNWVIRYVCEKADRQVIDKLGTEAIEKGKQSEITYFKLIVAPREALAEKKVAATSVLSIFKACFSPDNKYVAYLMVQPEEEGDHAPAMKFSLFVASLQQDVKAMLVRSPVAFGYDWRDDGRAIAYMQGEYQDRDLAIGSLDETTVLDEDGKLLAQPAPSCEEGTVHTHVCTGHTEGHAGVLFYPWTKVEYGPSGRIFFSSALLSLPSVQRDEPGWSLFCYDSVTGSITDVLSPELSAYTSETMNVCQFTLSPDRKRVLLPIKKNRFMCYKLGSKSAEFSIEESEGFGDDNGLELAPAWKGNEQISCLVSENSQYLGKEKTGRKEIAVLGLDGALRQILSQKWWPELKLTTESQDSSLSPGGVLR